MPNQKKLCQIIVYGGKDQWVRMGLREYTETSLLLLINANTTISHPLLEDHDNVRESIDYKSLASNLVKTLTIEEEGLPKKKQRKYKTIIPPDSRDLTELIRYFRGVLFYLHKNNYRIIINISSGLLAFRLALYQAALDCKKYVDQVYIIEKDTGEIKIVWLYREISDAERTIIDILYNKPNISKKNLQQQYYKIEGKGNLTYISRIIKKMRQDELVNELIQGNTRYLSLSDTGRALGPTKNLISNLKKQLGDIKYNHMEG